MRVLVTGAAGFIGSHLCDRLLAGGHSVTGLDDCSTGRAANVAHLQIDPRFSLTVGSATDVALVDRMVRESDAVMHLAAVVGVKLVIAQPRNALEVNTAATTVVLQAAARHERPVLYTSTSEVYGTGAVAPSHEDQDLLLSPPHSARSSYACSKAMGEYLALAYWRDRQLPVTVARLFNTVGPRQTGQYGMVLPRLVRQALAQEALTVYGDGRQTRSFCHVSDVTEALVRLACAPGAGGAVVNIGRPTETSIHELARMVIAVTRSTSEIKFIPYDCAYGDGFEDPRRRVPDIARLKGLIGWEPNRSLHTIVRDVAEYTADYLRDDTAGTRVAVSPRAK